MQLRRAMSVLGSLVLVLPMACSGKTGGTSVEDNSGGDGGGNNGGNIGTGASGGSVP